RRRTPTNKTPMGRDAMPYTCRGARILDRRSKSEPLQAPVGGKRQSAPRAHGRRRGSVLLIVLVVIVLLSLAAYQFNDLTTVESDGVDNHLRVTRAWLAAGVGVHYAMGLLSAYANNAPSAPSGLDDLLNIPASMSNDQIVNVDGDDAQQPRFALLAYNSDGT